MDLIDEIGDELAFAFLVERKLSNKIARREALDLIGKVKKVLITDNEDNKKDMPRSKKRRVFLTNHTNL